VYEQLETRLRSQEPAILSAVLDTAGVRRSGEPGHREDTAALVDIVMGRSIGLLDDRAAPGEDDGEALRGIGARYAVSQVSFDQLLHEFHRTLIEVSRSWWAVAGPADVGVLLRLIQSFEREVEPSRLALGEGYHLALAATGTRSACRRRLIEALLTGRPPDRPLLLAAGVTVAQNYLVLCTRTAADRGPAEEVARRLGTAGALVHRQDGLLLALLPASRLALVAPAEPAATGFARLAAATGATVAGASVVEVGSVPEAVDEARSIFDIAAACDRRGAVLAGDVLVERALVGGPAAVSELADIVSALTRWPHLSATMLALYDNDLDRSRTAKTLHIARRTLTQRLERIHQLTGLRPTSALGVQTFMCAIAAQRMTRHGAAADVDAG
jgi:hypothetical protein